MFADDLNVFQEFARETPDEVIYDELGKCRSNVHTWGQRNRVAFDASKEHLLILHPTSGNGDPFKLLGCLIDTKLTMAPAIEHVLSQVRPRITALLRTRRHYTIAEMIGQFKTHIWGSMECHSGAIYHAATSHLSKLARCQSSYLHQLGLNE